MSLSLVIGSDQGMMAAAVIEIFWSTRSERDLNHQHALCVFDSPLFAADNPFCRTAPASVAKAISDAADDANYQSVFSALKHLDFSSGIGSSE